MLLYRYKVRRILWWATWKLPSPCSKIEESISAYEHERWPPVSQGATVHTTRTRITNLWVRSPYAIPIRVEANRVTKAEAPEPAELSLSVAHNHVDHPVRVNVLLREPAVLLLRHALHH